MLLYLIYTGIAGTIGYVLSLHMKKYFAYLLALVIAYIAVVPVYALVCGLCAAGYVWSGLLLALVVILIYGSILYWLNATVVKKAEEKRQEEIQERMKARRLALREKKETIIIRRPRKISSTHIKK